MDGPPATSKRSDPSTCAHPLSHPSFQHLHFSLTMIEQSPAQSSAGSANETFESYFPTTTVDDFKRRLVDIKLPLNSSGWTRIQTPGDEHHMDWIQTYPGSSALRGSILRGEYYSKYSILCNLTRIEDACGSFPELWNFDCFTVDSTLASHWSADVVNSDVYIGEPSSEVIAALKAFAQVSFDHPQRAGISSLFCGRDVWPAVDEFEEQRLTVAQVKLDMVLPSKACSARAGVMTTSYMCYTLTQDDEGIIWRQAFDDKRVAWPPGRCPLSSVLKMTDRLLTQSFADAVEDSALLLHANTLLNMDKSPRFTWGEASYAVCRSLGEKKGILAVCWDRIGLATDY